MTKQSFPNHIKSGASILVAEREPIARTSLSELLREDGFSVLEAADSSSAVDHINVTPNLNGILVDLTMASLSSIIKQAQRTIPGAFILGMASDPMYSSEARSLGLHEYVVKPLVFEDLQKTINRLMTGYPRR
jgi:CheY-like chemotaxis protein